LRIDFVKQLAHTNHRTHKSELGGNQKGLFCSFHVFLASFFILLAVSKIVETIAFSLSSRVFRPPKTLFTNRFPCQQCLGKRIAKISSSTNLIRIANKQTSKAKSSWIVFTAKKNLSRLFTRSNVATTKKLF
jgi:hypothetical protein